MTQMEDYDRFSDEQLQQLACRGDLRAEALLVTRYARLVERCARPYYLAGGENSDLQQEGMFGLLSAIRSYASDQNIPFRAYAELCIRRQIISAIRSASRLKHDPLNQGVSLETLIQQSRKANPRLVPDQRRSPEEQVLARESAKEYFQSFSRYLSDFEQKVLSLYLDGCSYRRIAAELGREEKAVDNAVQRIRRKLARIPFPGDNSES